MPEADLINQLLNLGGNGAMAAALVFLGLRYLPHFIKLNEGITALTAAVQGLAQRVDKVEEAVDEMRREQAILNDRAGRGVYSGIARRLGEANG